MEKRTYKDYEKICIGCSDVAALVFYGFENARGLKAQVVKFGGDETYYAYIVTDVKAEIGAHYKKVARFNDWIEIYDDDGKTAEYYGDEINIYRAGDYGCIIQIIES